MSLQGPLWPKIYTLPCSPDFLVEDRFSILDSDETTVPFWEVFSALLSRTVPSSSGVLDLLESLAIILRGRSENSDGLQIFLQRLPQQFWKITWPAIAALALRLPSLFPTHQLVTLSHETSRQVLSREQTACLVIHQFLCTLSPPVWQESYQDFSIWYSGEQHHARVVEAYLTALFEYFDYITNTHEEWNIVYELVDNDQGLFDAGSQKLGALNVCRLDEPSTHPDLLGLPDGAAVVSANRFIGFGKTGTQEEVHIGASPEACPVVLYSPPLEAQDVVIVTGAQPMVSIKGYARSARCEEILPREGLWAHRRMLFMDALELDLADESQGKPVDVQPGNVERDLRKAYITFKSMQQAVKKPMVYTGLWGCGAFGGNPEIKACIQWCAASLSGCELTFICAGEGQQSFGGRLEKFVEEMLRRDVAAGALKQVLLSLTPQSLSNDSPLEKIRLLLTE